MRFRNSHFVFWFSFTLLLSVLIPFSGCERTSGTSLSLEFSPATLEIGEVLPNKEFDFNVEVTNAGKKLVLIEKLSASCGCTLPELSGKRIPVNESVDMAVGFKAPPDVGDFAHQIVLKCDEGSFVFDVYGSASWPIVGDKSVVRVENRLDGESDAIELFSHKKEPFKVLSVESSNPGIVVDEIAVTPISAKFEVSISEELDLTQEHAIVFKTDNADRSAIEIAVKLFTMRERTISPSRFVLPIADGESRAELSLTVGNCENSVVDVVAKKSDGDTIAVNSCAITAKDDRTQTVKFNLEFGKLEKMVRRSFLLKFEDGTQQELPITLFPRTGN